jgi:hypothetical protein
MAYLVRKINKRKNIDALRGNLDIDKLTADMPTGELRTTNGALSTWIIESLGELNEAVLAIAVTSSKVSKMDFMIIDIEILNDHELEYKQTYAGRDIPIPDLQNTHYDIVNLSMGKLKNCVLAYKDVVDKDVEGKFVVRYAEGQIKAILKKAFSDKRVDISKAEGGIKDMFIQFADIA